MTLQIALITVDANDPISLANFWAEVTGGTITESGTGAFVGLQSGPGLAFQKVEAPTPGKNRLHVDFGTSDLDGEQARLLELGAQQIGEFGDSNFRWVQFADPEGNVFDVAQQV